MFPQAAVATTHLLERLGVEVDFPTQQACCGQMHINTGYFKDALPLIKNHVKTFEPLLSGEWDYVVAPSSSCVGSLRDQAPMVARQLGEIALSKACEQINAKTLDLTEFLIDVLQTEDVGAYFPHTVTYHTTCHSLRITKVGDRPERLLKAVKGMTYIPLPDNEQCCGFGGTFSMKNPDTSRAMVADKMKNVMATGAEVLVAGDYSCLMNIGGGLMRLNSGIRCIHLAELLAGTQDQPWDAPKWTTKMGAV